jgi:hypothetical protein
MTEKDQQTSGADDGTEVIQGKRTASAAARAGTARADAKAEGQTKVWIRIPKTKEETRDVFVGHNCVGYRVKRGVDVEVPEGVVHALEIAIGTTLVPEEDPVTKRIIMTPQETQSYPFQILRTAPSSARA